MAKAEKKCWACKRIIVGKGHLGLCPKCVDKYGSPAAALAVLGLGLGGTLIVKNGDKIIGVVGKGIKMIKP